MVIYVGKLATEKKHCTYDSTKQTKPRKIDSITCVSFNIFSNIYNFQPSKKLDHKSIYFTPRAVYEKQSLLGNPTNIVSKHYKVVRKDFFVCKIR